MKRTVAILCFLMFASVVIAKGGGHSSSSGSHKSGTVDGTHSVRGYYKKDGTYVAPHRSTNSDETKANNWSTKGNVNPDTGKEGTKDPNR